MHAPVVDANVYLSKQLALFRTGRLAAKRLGEPEELANLACFLVSPYASWVTGQIFTLDGGEKSKLSGEMNALDRVTPEMWDKMEEMIRGKGNK